MKKFLDNLKFIQFFASTIVLFFADLPKIWPPFPSFLLSLSLPPAVVGGDGDGPLGCGDGDGPIIYEKSRDYTEFKNLIQFQYMSISIIFKIYLLYFWHFLWLIF